MDTRADQPERLVKITFYLEPDAWHGSATETVWAEALGGQRYRVRNSPFYVFDVSFEDIVAARQQSDELVFSSVLLRAGHSTYRIIVARGMEDRFVVGWAELQRLGCSYEQGSGRLYAVDVPPWSDISEVYARLEAGEQQAIWSFEEGHCGHPVSS